MAANWWQRTQAYRHNPISIFLLFAIGVLIVLGAANQVQPISILRNLALPYSVDFARGIGQRDSNVVRVILFSLQLVIFGLIYLRANYVVTRRGRGIVVFFGITISIVYLLLVISATFINGFH